MDIQVLNKDKKSGKVSFLIKNTTPALANALRRSIIELLPTMAIDAIEFVQNSSVLYDEIIAHRLGLIPIRTDLKAYNIPKECRCKGEGCASCTLKLVLKAKGPGTVLAKDIKSKDPKVKPVYPDTPIAELGKNQELEFIATAKLGTGKEHAKFIPALIWFTFEPTITVNNNSPKFEEFKSKFPPKVFDSSGKIDKKLILDNNLVDACGGVCEDVVKIEYNKSNIIFNIEPWGQLTAAEIVSNAADKFLEIAEEFDEKITK